MKKIVFIITTFVIIINNYSCTLVGADNSDLVPLAGIVYFYSNNDTTQLYLFSQGVDLGTATVITNANQQLELENYNTVELPITSYNTDIHTYEFFAKKIDVDNPVVQGNITIEGKNITVEATKGIFELDSTFVEFDMPNIVIRIDE